MERAKIKVNTIDFPSLEFFRLCSMVEAQVITLSDMVLYEEELFKTITL